MRIARRFGFFFRRDFDFDMAGKVATASVGEG